MSLNATVAERLVAHRATENVLARLDVHLMAVQYRAEACVSALMNLTRFGSKAAFARATLGRGGSHTMQVPSAIRHPRY